MASGDVSKSVPKIHLLATREVQHLADSIKLALVANEFLQSVPNNTAHLVTRQGRRTRAPSAFPSQKQARLTSTRVMQAAAAEPEDRLQTCFEGAYYVNFTHSAKWADDSAGTPHCALRAAVIRGMAIICEDNANFVDALIRVFRPRTMTTPLEDATISPEDMTAITV